MRVVIALRRLGDEGFEIGDFFVGFCVPFGEVEDRFGELVVVFVELVVAFGELVVVFGELVVVIGESVNEVPLMSITLANFCWWLVFVGFRPGMCIFCSFGGLCGGWVGRRVCILLIFCPVPGITSVEFILSSTSMPIDKGITQLASFATVDSALVCVWHLLAKLKDVSGDVKSR